MSIAGLREEDVGKVFRVSVALPDEVAGPFLGMFTMAGLKVLPLPFDHLFLPLISYLPMQVFELEVASDENAGESAQQLSFDLKISKSSFQVPRSLDFVPSLIAM